MIRLKYKIIAIGMQLIYHFVEMTILGKRYKPSFAKILSETLIYWTIVYDKLVSSDWVWKALRVKYILYIS